ncbi:mercury resistance system periplasmic binding protein MerP [Noviherbaspirillum sp.]|uniref:mercury resistance system periplasmic binding protein MerP n=1 Tax=Noviherbaspirillum sp. TaxID=1926288 RepID=UPI002B49BE45|nr:mercury resistance system periplasmic binding protein MerP [Noviherbaspirillum sp.]HJV81763.1 mercury resistance system periplasmic binding protein MerP [Noviherbaspirillum sp.]
MPKILVSPLLAALLCLPQFASAKSRTVSLNVPTMDCATCPITIKAALLKVPGVSRAKVSYERREAVVVFDDDKATVADLKNATENAGYPSMLKEPLK